MSSFGIGSQLVESVYLHVVLNSPSDRDLNFSKESSFCALGTLAHNIGTPTWKIIFLSGFNDNKIKDAYDIHTKQKMYNES